MPIELTGQIHFIGETQTFGKFTKRPFILRIPNPRDSKYDDFVPLACVRDKVKLLDDFREGDECVASIDIKGRLAKDDDTKAYADLECWKLTATGTRREHRDDYRHGTDKFNRPPERQERRPSEPVRRQDARRQGSEWPPDDGDDPLF